MCKNTTFLKNIIFKHLPDMFPTETSRQQALKYPKVFNVEHLTEIALAKVGGYEFIDAAHCDFSDGTEAKTGSVSVNPQKKGVNTYRGEISNVISSGGQIKTGAIRFCLYIPHTKSIKYFYIPSSKINTLGINVHPTTNMGRIFFTYNAIKDCVPKLAQFEVSSFETVATI